MVPSAVLRKGLSIYMHLWDTLIYVEEPMEKQNITLSLPKDLLQRARILALKRGVSLSRMLSGYLEELVLDDEVFTEARPRHLAALREGLDLGTQRVSLWTREELHER